MIELQGTKSNYRIRKYDERNLVIERLHYANPDNKLTKHTEPSWIVAGYYGSLKHLVGGLLDLELLDTDIDETGLIEQVTRLQATIMRCTDQLIATIKEVDYE